MADPPKPDPPKGDPAPDPKADPKADPPDPKADDDDDATPPDDTTEAGRLKAEAIRWRREAREQRRRADELAARAEAEAATAADRLAKLEAAERRNARATIERLAVAAGFHAGEPAHELDTLTDLLAADDGEAAVAARLKVVAGERPYLLAPANGGGRVLTPGRQSDVEDTAAAKDAWLRA